jgi:exopolysaccharide biosynthesis protein
MLSKYLYYISFQIYFYSFLFFLLLSFPVTTKRTNTTPKQIQKNNKQEINTHKYKNKHYHPKDWEQLVHNNWNQSKAAEHSLD